MMHLLLLISSFLTLVELNCENLFDCRHDEGKQDYEYLPGAERRWSHARYWRKLNNIAQELLACSPKDAGFVPPDIIALCEVENDSVVFDLTRRSLLRPLGYEYIITNSDDRRGIDVALVYHPFSFAPICSNSIKVPLVKHMKPTRDILYVKGRVVSGDTIHIFVVHAPSRYGGERLTRPYRMSCVSKLAEVVDSIYLSAPSQKVIIMGDFNDPSDSRSLAILKQHRLRNATKNARGRNGAKGSYKFEGRWQSIDHIFVSNSLWPKVMSAYVNDAMFLLEEDTDYGGMKPRRCYRGMRWQEGFSDHLPLVVTLSL